MDKENVLPTLQWPSPCLKHPELSSSGVGGGGKATFVPVSVLSLYPLPLPKLKNSLSKIATNPGLRSWPNR